jgi:hypothetical protein
MASTEAILTALRKRFRSDGHVPHDEMDMLHETGKAPEALLYSLLFVPTLFIVDDSVLLMHGVDDAERHFLEAKRASGMPLERLEASINRVEIPFLSSTETSTMTRSACSRNRLPRHGAARWRCSVPSGASW